MNDLRPTPNAAWSAMGPIDQWASIASRDSSFLRQAGAKDYFADAVVLTEAGRLAYITHCLVDEKHPVAYANCQADIEAFDISKFGVQMRVEKSRSAFDRMTVRFMAADVQDRLAAHTATVKQLFAKDPVYVRLFEIAKQTRTTWNQHAQGRADLLALVLAMDDARATNSRKALAGCSDRAWPAFVSAISKLGAKRFEKLQDDPDKGITFSNAAIGAVLQDPDAYLAANALVACEGHADDLLATLGKWLSHWSGFRGPRTATLTALRLADLKPDARDVEIKHPPTQRSLAIERVEKSSDGGSAKGMIATVTPQGDGVRVTFPAKSEVQESCTSRRNTHRLSRIDSSGNLVYETECTQWETTRVDTTQKPVIVRKRYAAGLEPKRYVSITGGVVEGVWTKPSAPMPIAAFGVVLR